MTDFEQVKNTKRAWLYCTYFGDFWLLGEIENEGSFEELINHHCYHNGEDHRHTIHILVEGSPDWDAFQEFDSTGSLQKPMLSGELQRYCTERYAWEAEQKFLDISSRQGDARLAARAYMDDRPKQERSMQITRVIP